MSRLVIQAYRLTENSPTGLRLVQEYGSHVDVLVIDYECPDLRREAERLSDLRHIPWVCTVQDAA